MATKSYEQYCPVACALDVVGDRWTLLILRDLLVAGPRRYAQLQRSLAGISPTLLAERLATLVDEGLVARDEHGSGHAYALTDAGRGIAPVLASLARFGLARLPRPAGTRPDTGDGPDGGAGAAGAAGARAGAGVGADTATIAPAGAGAAVAGPSDSGPVFVGPAHTAHAAMVGLLGAWERRRPDRRRERYLVEVDGEPFTLGDLTPGTDRSDGAGAPANADHGGTVAAGPDGVATEAQADVGPDSKAGPGGQAEARRHAEAGTGDEAEAKAEAGGRASVATERAQARPVLTVALTAATLWDLRQGDTSWDEAVADGSIAVTGSKAATHRFRTRFAL